MVNTDDFIKKLEIILDYYNLNASSFADKIGVQRSSMSHLLSGRNKPSLDFILKIIDFFPDVDLYWILNGKGTFPKNSESTENLNPNPIAQKNNSAPSLSIDLFSQTLPLSEQNVNQTKTNEIANSISKEINDEIEKIVFFYKNGTFKVYTPNSF